MKQVTCVAAPDWSGRDHVTCREPVSFSSRAIMAMACFIVVDVLLKKIEEEEVGQRSKGAHVYIKEIQHAISS